MSTRLQQRLSFFLNYMVGGAEDVEKMAESLEKLDKSTNKIDESSQKSNESSNSFENQLASLNDTTIGVSERLEILEKVMRTMPEVVSDATLNLETLRYELETGKISQENYAAGIASLTQDLADSGKSGLPVVRLQRQLFAEQQRLNLVTKKGSSNISSLQQTMLGLGSVLRGVSSESGVSTAALGSLFGNVNLLNNKVSEGIPTWKVFLNFLKGPAGLLLLATAIVPVLIMLNKELGVVKTRLYDTKAAGDSAATALKNIRDNWINAFKEENVPENPIEKAKKDLEILDEQIQALGGSRSVSQKIGNWLHRSILQIGALNEAFGGLNLGSSVAFTDLEAQNVLLNNLTDERKKIFGELIQLEKIYGNQALNNRNNEAEAEKERKRSHDYYVNTLLPSQLAQDLKASEFRIAFMQREAVTFSQIEKHKNELLGQLKLRQENEVDLLNNQLEKNEISADNHEKRLLQINNSYAQERVEIAGWEFDQKRQLRLQMYEMDEVELANSQKASDLRISILQREALSIDRINKEKAEKQQQLSDQEKHDILTLERSFEEGLISKEHYESELLSIQQSYAHRRVETSIWEYEQHRQLRLRMLALDEEERRLAGQEMEWKLNLLQREGLTMANIENLRKQRLDRLIEDETNSKNEIDRLYRDGEINAAEHERRLTLLHREGVLQRSQIDQDSIDDEKSLRDQQLMFAEDLANSLMGLGSVIYGSSEKNAKKAFILDKALSLASTATFGALAYVRALATNPATAPFVAASVALNIAKILTTKFKGRASAPEAAKTESFQYGFRGIAGSTESGITNMFNPQMNYPDTLKLVDSGGNFLANLQYAQDKEGIQPYMPIPTS